MQPVARRYILLAAVALLAAGLSLGTLPPCLAAGTADSDGAVVLAPLSTTPMRVRRARLSLPALFETTHAGLPSALYAILAGPGKQVSTPGSQGLALLKPLAPLLASACDQLGTSEEVRLASGIPLVGLPAPDYVRLAWAQAWPQGGIQKRSRGWFTARPPIPTLALTTVTGTRRLIARAAGITRRDVGARPQGGRLAPRAEQARTSCAPTSILAVRKGPVASSRKATLPASALRAPPRQTVATGTQEDDTRVDQVVPPVTPPSGLAGAKPSSGKPTAAIARGGQQERRIAATPGVPAGGPGPQRGFDAGARLEPGDVVALTVLDEPKLTGQFAVREDGKLNLPLVGMVQAAGLTCTQLEDTLTKLCSKYLVKPVVSVMPVSTAPRLVSVLGEVARPGAYDAKQAPTVLALIAVAGGTKPTADLQRAVLLRQGREIPLTAEGAQGGLPEDLPLQAGDVVEIPARTSPMVHVTGAVVKPGAKPLVLARTAAKAVVLAGGPAPMADLSKAYLLRGKQRIDLNLAPLLSGEVEGSAKDEVLEPDDVLVVPQRVEGHVFVVGAVHAPGALKAIEAKRLSQAVAMAGGLTEAANKKAAYVMRHGKKIPVDLAAIFDEGQERADIELEEGDAVVVPEELPVFHIVGEVQKPGVYKLSQASSVLDAWALAGGALEDADLRAAVLLREGEKPRVVDLEALVNRGDMSQNVALQPGDKLVVPRALQYCYVLGQVNKPGPQPLRPGDTLIDILARAGGPSPMADVRGITIIHREALLQAQAEGRTSGRRYRRKGEKAQESEEAAGKKKASEPPKVTLIDLARVQAGEEQYVARDRDVIYVPTSEEFRRSEYKRTLISSITALLVGYAIRR